MNFCSEMQAEPETDEVYAQMLLLPIQNPVSAKSWILHLLVVAVWSCAVVS